MNTVQRDGLLLAASAVVAMVVMNSPWATGFDQLLQQRITLGQGWLPGEVTVSLRLLINDMLMVIFFLAVGIEIRHEWQHGALATQQARALPLGAALGGMAVPALIYLACNWHTPANLLGWAIPSATDIAFALGLMALVAPHTRPALLAFLTAVAVLDDLGAIVIIALFYTDQLSSAMLGYAAVAVAVLLGLSRMRVRRVAPYLLVGTVLWLCVLQSGVHATLAGVITGLLIPNTPPADHSGLQPNETDHGPSGHILHAIKPWISWLILPLFGVVNAGVSLADMQWASLLQPVTLGILLGLMVGKPIGIMLGTWLASKLAGGLPAGFSLMDYLPAACFCGIGFTMALFIGTLAFDMASPVANAAKLGVLCGSLCAFVLGTAVARLRS